MGHDYFFMMTGFWSGWMNSVKVGRYNRRNWISTGFWECNKVFDVFVGMPSTRGCLSCDIWRGKSCRVIGGVGYVLLGSFDLTDEEFLFSLYLLAWVRSFYGQDLLFQLNIYMTYTSNLCTLFPYPFFFLQGFVWQGFLMRQCRWMITFLVIILHLMCTMDLIRCGIPLDILDQNMKLHVNFVEEKIWSVH